MKSPLFASAFFALLLVGVTNLVGIFFHLFYTINWFDMGMHFLGGFFVAVSTLAILTRHTSNFSYGQLLAWGLVSACILGILWELFELYFHITSLQSPSYIGDNGMDLTMDVFGGLLAVLYSYFKIRTSDH